MVSGLNKPAGPAKCEALPVSSSPLGPSGTRPGGGSSGRYFADSAYLCLFDFFFESFSGSAQAGWSAGTLNLILMLSLCLPDF